jgi:hypothetical protein
LLLENGLDVSKIGLTAQESQYIESRNYQLGDIARIFRVPGVMLGMGDKTSTYASAEQFFNAYVKHTIMPWVVRIEQTIQRDLILPSEQALFAKHQLSSLLRADQKTRFETYQIGIASHFMLPNEAREAEDWNHIDGGDEFPVLQGQTDSAQKPPQKGGKPAPDNQNNQDNEDSQARRLAGNIAETVIRSERREFTRQGKSGHKMTAGHVANFTIWLEEHVARLTGCSDEAAKKYATWRQDGGLDPLHAETEKIARQALINLCLGVRFDF